MGWWDVSSCVMVALLVTGATSCYTQDMKCYGDVTPNVSYVFHGENVSLTCTLFDDMDDGSGLNAEEFHFLVNDTEVLQKYVTVTSNRTLVLNYPAERCASGTFFYCQSTVGVLPRMADYSRVIIDHEPVIVNSSSIDCRVKNWDSMMCTWKLGTDFCYPENLDVTLQYAISSQLMYNCSVQTITSCEWLGRNFNFGMLHYLRIRVEYKNSERWTRTGWIPVRPDDQIVEPNPVKNLATDVRNSSYTIVSWRAPFDYEIEYRIKWTSEYLESWETVTTNLSAVANDLIACARYRIIVDCRPLCKNVGGCGYWSKPTTVDFQMLENVPGAPPQTTNGSIYNLQCEGFGCRKTRIYWKSIPHALQHGVIINQEVKYRSQKPGSEWSTVKVSAADTSVDLTSLNSTYDYVVNINARTSVGLADNPSVIYLAHLDQGLKAPDNFIVQEDQQLDTVSLQWTASVGPTDVPVQGYTVYWCPRELCRNFVCKLDLHWIHVSSDTTSHTLVLDSSQIYGVSAEYGRGQSSGLNWANCIYIKNEVPPGPPPNVVLSVPRVYGIHVSWEPYTCSSNAPYITDYIVNYCQQTVCPDDTTQIYISGDQRSHDLTELDSKTEYGVSVVAVSDKGSSPVSEIQYIKVTDNLLSAGAQVGVSMATLLGVFIMGVGIFYIARRCKNAKKDFHNINIHTISPDTAKPLSSEEYTHLGDGYINNSFPPNLTNGTTRPPYQKQHSIDSGISSPKISPNEMLKTPTTQPQFDYSQISMVSDNDQSNIQVFTVLQGHKVQSQDSDQNGKNDAKLTKFSFHNLALSSVEEEENEFNVADKQFTSTSSYISNINPVQNHEKQQMSGTSSKDSGIALAYSQIAESSDDDHYIESDSAGSELKCKDQFVSPKHVEDQNESDVPNQDDEISSTAPGLGNNIVTKNPYLTYNGTVFKSRSGIPQNSNVSNGDSESESRNKASLILNTSTKLPNVKTPTEAEGNENHSICKNDSYIPHKDMIDQGKKMISQDPTIELAYSKIGEAPVVKFSGSELNIKDPSESLKHAEVTSLTAHREDNGDAGDDSGISNSSSVEDNAMNSSYVPNNVESGKSYIQNSSTSDGSEENSKELYDINSNAPSSTYMSFNPPDPQYQTKQEVKSMTDIMNNETIESKSNTKVQADSLDSSNLMLNTNGYVYSG